MIFLFNDMGIDTGWRILNGPPDFYNVTKKFHNGMQGQSINLNRNKKQLYMDTNERFSKITHLDHDCVIIHDPQPLPLIKFFKKNQPWIWRCHIDITEPSKELWDYLKSMVLRYDIMIISNKAFRKKELPLEQRIIYPSIDPLSHKNMDLTDAIIAKMFKKSSVPLDKPIITQVSRFDPWKDPEGVLKVYELVRERMDCRLVYCYNIATDDPEAIKVYQSMAKKAAKYLNSGDILFIQGDNQVLVNALQRKSDVILQKSTREGFGLTISEASWKGTPVVASRVGGIPEQVLDGKTGFLVDPKDYQDCADKIITLLKDKKLAREMGRKGREFIRERFLITRHIADYLDLLIDVINR
jgi:trehalose synthase